jgi:hypothetical protein
MDYNLLLFSATRGFYIFGETGQRKSVLRDLQGASLFAGVTAGYNLWTMIKL